MSVLEMNNIQKHFGDLEVLKSAGIINTMEYWANHYNDLVYLPDLIRNMANYLRGVK